MGPLQRIGTLAWAAALLGWPLAAGAELPPWVYGQQQRQASVVLDLQVVDSRPCGQQQCSNARVLAVRRQRAGQPLRAGQRIVLIQERPAPRAPGWAGPSPLAVPQPGARLTAWLSPIPQQPGRYGPAAGGASFGPSLEAMAEPGTDTPPGSATNRFPAAL